MKLKLFKITSLFIILSLLFIPASINIIYAEDNSTLKQNNQISESKLQNESSTQDINDNKEKIEEEISSSIPYIYFSFNSFINNGENVTQEVFTNNKQEQQDLIDQGFTFNQDKNVFTKTSQIEEFENNDISSKTLSNKIGANLTNKSFTKTQEKINEILDLQNQISKKMSEFFTF